MITGLVEHLGGEQVQAVVLRVLSNVVSAGPLCAVVATGAFPVQADPVAKAVGGLEWPGVLWEAFASCN